MAYVYRRPVRELLASCTSRDLIEFLAWEEIVGPLGPWRDDFRMAVVASAAANANPNRKRGQMTKPADFLVEWDREVAELERRKGKPASYLQAKLFAFANARNAAAKRRGEPGPGPTSRPPPAA